MTPLRQRMLDAMVLRGLSPRTQESYADAIYAMAKVPAKQPELLARSEIARLFAACSHPVHRMLLQTMYAAGLRVSEACTLRVGDIDSAADRMCIRVACGKGGKGRYTILGASLLTYLRFYVRSYRPAFGHNAWLFCNASGMQPVSIESAQRAYQGSRHRAGIMKRAEAPTPCGTALPPTC